MNSIALVVFHPKTAIVPNVADLQIQARTHHFLTLASFEDEMFKFCASICFGVMFVMSGVVSAEDAPVDLYDSNDPGTVFPNENPPTFVPMPPLEFPVAPVDEGLSHAMPQFNPALFPSNEPRMIDLVMPQFIPEAPVDGDFSDGLQAIAIGVVAGY